jgi:hypothetical protein
MIRGLLVLFDSNLRQADVVFNGIIHEMPNLREFCVEFRSPLDFFYHTGAPRCWWVERMCQVRVLRKFDLRFEDESFSSGLEMLHYTESGHGPQVDACVLVLKHICESSTTDRNAMCKDSYIEDLHRNELYQKVCEFIEQVLMEDEREEAKASTDDSQADTNEAGSQDDSVLTPGDVGLGSGVFPS